MDSSARHPRPLAPLSEQRASTLDAVVGRWDDPNPSTQMQVQDLGIQTEQIQEYDRATDLGCAPTFNHALNAALKDAEAYRYNRYADEDDDTPEEQRAFTSVPYTLPFVGTGEDVFFDASGENVIINDNANELALRFRGDLYKAALDDRYEPTGTNANTFGGLAQTSTLFDKQTPFVNNSINLDSSLIISSQAGYASLRPDFMRNCPEAPGININEPLSIGQFLDAPLRNDEILEDFTPQDKLPSLGSSKVAVAYHVAKSFKR